MGYYGFSLDVCVSDCLPVSLSIHIFVSERLVEQMSRILTKVGMCIDIVEI